MATLEQHPLRDVSRSESDLPAATASWRLIGNEVEWRRAAGGILIVVGLFAIAAGWFGVSGTDAVWEQLPFLLSGGLGGAALVGIGLALVLTYEHARDRELILHLLRRLEELEYGMAGEFDELRAHLSAPNGSRARARR